MSRSGRPQPGQSGASSLPSNSHCMPRQMPSSGRPSPTRARMASIHGRSSARVAPKCPTPGTTTAATPRTSRSGASGVKKLRAERGERLPHRRQVARAVVDQRDHSSPFVRRQHLGEPLVLGAGDAQRAGERLEDRFDLVMARSAVHHLHVHVGAGADREPFEEIVDELGLQIADPRGAAPSDRRRRAAGRRGRRRRPPASRPSASRSSRRG